jgi:hypothetical protein
MADHAAMGGKLVLLTAVGLALALAALLGGGCSESENCPNCPGAPIVIERVQVFPESLTIGDTLRIWVTARGTDLRYQWAAEDGRFLLTDRDFARWKAPANAAVTEITVLAYNDEHSAVQPIPVTVNTYVPRHEPTYTGAHYCGQECHNVTGHGDYFATWENTAHAAAYAGVESDPYFNHDCFACHTVGWGDVNEDGWIRHNGGFDEVPIERLQGVQCESCHGPLSDRGGQILDDHASMAIGDFLLEACDRCHTDEGLVPPDAANLHAPHTEMLAGEGGYEYDREMSSSPHKDEITRGCVTCHFPTSADGNGHTFAADPTSCTACHAEANGEDFTWSTAMTEVADLLEQLQEELSRATEEDQRYLPYRWANHNATFAEKDASSGAHNYLYAKELLETSIEDFEPSGSR